MIKISKQNNSLIVEGIENAFYINNGDNSYTLNSLIVVTDNSDMATFRSVATNDVLFSGLIKDITINGEAVTKDNIIQKFYYDNNKKNILQEKFSTIKSKFKSNDFDILETKFLDFIMENNLINVIGMTTSSRQSIEINNIKKNLFSDYSIDVMLIDEISKSSTPEILSKVVLSKKTILSGDYLQLPPSPEFNSDEELEELLNFMIDNLHKQYIKKIAN